MKTTRVIVRFAQGLHARPAARLVSLFRRFRSRVLFRAGNRVANATSVLSLLLLAAPANTPLEVQVSGDDEEEALAAAVAFFAAPDERAWVAGAGMAAPRGAEGRPSESAPAAG